MKQMFEKVKGDSTHDEGDLENNNDENYTRIEKRIKNKEDRCYGTNIEYWRQVGSEFKK